MKRPRRSHTAVFEAKVALAALKGDKTMQELVAKYDVHGNRHAMEVAALEVAVGVFLSPAEKRGGEQGPSPKDMQTQIGQLTLENEFLEVALGRIGDASAKR